MLLPALQYRHTPARLSPALPDGLRSAEAGLSMMILQALEVHR